MKLDTVCGCGKRDTWTSLHEARWAAVNREWQLRKQRRWHGKDRLTAYRCQVDPAVYHYGNSRDHGRLRRVK